MPVVSGVALRTAATIAGGQSVTSVSKSKSNDSAALPYDSPWPNGNSGSCEELGGSSPDPKMAGG